MFSHEVLTDLLDKAETANNLSTYDPNHTTDRVILYKGAKLDLIRWLRGELEKLRKNYNPLN